MNICKMLSQVSLALLVIMCLIPEQETAAYNFFEWFEPRIEAVEQDFKLADSDINPAVYRKALHAYKTARKEGAAKKELLTIIDYSLPSNKKRLWVIDLKHHTVPYHDYVAHGKNSGFLKSNSFSNASGSKKSSIGVYKTGNTYYGKHGYSLRLIGLEKGFNSHAAGRSIVIHSAYYATKAFIERTGRLGRSWGCPAISPKISNALISKIKGGSLVFAYYPNKHWLNTSHYL